MAAMYGKASFTATSSTGLGELCAFTQPEGSIEWILAFIKKDLCTGMASKSTRMEEFKRVFGKRTN